MNKIRCHSCAKVLPEGSLKYVVEVKSFADFDGHLEEYPDDLERGMEELLQEMECMDQKVLEDDVYQEMIFILCKSCKNKLYQEIFNTSSQFGQDSEAKGLLH